MYRSRTTATARRSGGSAGARFEGLFASSSLDRQTSAAMASVRSRLHLSFRGTPCAPVTRVSSSRQLPVCAFWAGGVGCVLSLGCGSLPLPPPVPPPETDFVGVAAPPPPARGELVPPPLKGARFWVDGSWMWEGSRWKWAPGGWFAPPAGVQYVD